MNGKSTNPCNWLNTKDCQRKKTTEETAEDELTKGEKVTEKDEKGHGKKKKEEASERKSLFPESKGMSPCIPAARRRVSKSNAQMCFKCH